MLNGRQILVLEDESLLRKSLVAFLESTGADIYPAASLEEARRLIQATDLDFALLDINLPDGNALSLIEAQIFSKLTRIVVMTADGGIRTAVEAIRKGAHDYLSKPFDPEELPVVFRRIERLSNQARREEFARDSRAGQDRSLFMGNRLQTVRMQLEKVLKADHRLQSGLPPVLIEGETGTGKSTFARWIHQNGPRGSAPLVEINCSTLPDSLAESELFGHQRGAFTDARKERIGLFEAADTGSLFLDEIASLSEALQAKVLTAIEDGRIRRIGGNTEKQVDARVIAASLHPLGQLVEENLFREDLFHRLNLLHIRIPPLREYPEDLPALAEHILQQLRKRYRQPDLALSEKALAQICAYPWPGNVRELAHELERALIFAESGKLEFPHLEDPAAPRNPLQGRPGSLRNPAWAVPKSGFQLETALHDLTMELIEEALEAEKGNVSAAARLLGVPRDFIRYRINP